MHGYYRILFHCTNRLKRLKPNKPPPSHRICDEISEVTSLVRQCRSCDINYDENIVKIEGDISGIPESRLHNNEYSSDESVIDHERTPDNVSDCATKSGIPKKLTKKKSFKYLPFSVDISITKLHTCPRTCPQKRVQSSKFKILQRSSTNPQHHSSCPQWPQQSLLVVSMTSKLPY